MIGRMTFCFGARMRRGSGVGSGAGLQALHGEHQHAEHQQGPGRSNYNDALFEGDQCVARLKNIAGTDWAFIAYKLGKGNAHTPVEGWAALQYLQQASGAATRPPAAPRPPRHLPPPPAAPPGAPVTPSGTAAKSRPEDVLRFKQPIPFGAFPVNGHSIDGDDRPEAFPVEGLDEALWQKSAPRATGETRKDVRTGEDLREATAIRAAGSASFRGASSSR